MVHWDGAIALKWCYLIGVLICHVACFGRDKTGLFL